MSPDCDYCERRDPNEYSIGELIHEISLWARDLKEHHITILEEITREWRETH
ncbi:hypothetical protein LCGC14_1572980 [marine sediment metagenome]|uniref:Uncharacterized protein n=1 Tax=marine sediment metagenome TaxID=412755 RepID=A0A0F9LJK8_9ZZZZ